MPCNYFLFVVLKWATQLVDRTFEICASKKYNFLAFGIYKSGLMSIQLKNDLITKITSLFLI